MRRLSLYLIAAGFGCGFVWNGLHALVACARPVDSWWHRGLLDFLFALTLILLLEKDR